MSTQTLSPETKVAIREVTRGHSMLPTEHKLEMEARARALRQCGLSYFEVAQKLDIDETKAMQLVVCSLNRIKPETRETKRHLEARRLDELYKVVHKEVVENENIDAVNQAIKIMERRAKLEGLDLQSEVIPQQNVQVTLNFGEAEPGRNAIRVENLNEPGKGPIDGEFSEVTKNAFSDSENRNSI